MKPKLIYRRTVEGRVEDLPALNIDHALSMAYGDLGVASEQTVLTLGGRVVYSHRELALLRHKRQPVAPPTLGAVATDGIGTEERV